MDKKVAIISDVHGNLEALSEVLRNIKKEKVDIIYSLGDVIGYGVDPNACVSMLEKEKVVSLYGNHEKIILGQISADSKLCRVSTEWTNTHISDASRDIIKKYKEAESENNIFYSHSKPFDENFPYLNESEMIARAFPKKGIYFYGHTHRPRVTKSDMEGNVIQDYLVNEEQEITFSVNEHVMINVGSVGQARSNQTIANYVICEHYGEQIMVRFCFLPYEYYTAYCKVASSMGMEMADYLIREEWRRNKYKEKMVEK